MSNTLNENKLTNISKGGKHYPYGFFCISAERGDRTKEENAIQTKRLMQELKRLNLSYDRSYGGEWDHKNGAAPKIGEKSFIVYNYNTATGGRFSEKEFKRLAIILCCEFKQDDVFYKEPNSEKAYWLKNNGKVDARFNGQTYNDDKSQYFTSFNKQLKVDNSFKKPNKMNKSPKKYSANMVESYFNY